MVATFAAMALLYMLFSKFVPIISIWEMKVGNQPHPAHGREPERRGRSWPACGGRVREGHLRASTPIPTPRSARSTRLRAAGVAERDIVVMSSEPFEEYEFSHRDKRDLAALDRRRRRRGRPAGRLLAHQRHAACLADRAPAACRSWRPWPNLIVMFEMTMLGAILATVVTLFITAKLPTPSAAPLRPGGEQRLHPGRRAAAVCRSHRADEVGVGGGGARKGEGGGVTG